MVFRTASRQPEFVPGSHGMSSPDAMIDMQGIVKTFKNAAGEFTVLKGINLTINRGEFVSIVGKSGSGKSTLLNMITGIDHPTSGKMVIGGTDIYTGVTESQRSRWRGRNLGIVFQFFQLLPMLTLLENVMLAMDFADMYDFDERPGRAMELLKMVGLEMFANKLPALVSTGQQQLAAIARALACDPPLLVADEPTGNLDTKSANTIIDLFEQLTQSGKTVVMVTHDPSLTSRTTRNIIIVDGELVDETVARCLPRLRHRHLLEFTRLAEERFYQANDIILPRHAPVDHFFMIRSGHVEVILRDRQNSEVVISSLKPGEFFGEIELMGGSMSIADVRAGSAGSVELLVLHRDDFKRVIDQSPITAEAIERIVQQRLEEHRKVDPRKLPSELYVDSMLQMKPRWRKVLHDLYDNKGRTLLVVFSIAVGVFSIGVIAGTYQIISHDMSASYAAKTPGNIELRMTNFDDDTLNSIQNEEGVKAAEARRVFNMRVRVPGTEKWTTLDLTAFQDFETNSINLLTPVEGAAIPQKREIVLEKNVLENLDIGVGGQIEVELPDGSTKILPVVGIVQDTAAGAADFLASPFGYITVDTLPYLGQPRLYNRVYATVTEDGDDIEYIRDIGAQLKDKLEKNGNIVIRSRFFESHKHPLADTVNAVLGILMALGILILFLSGSLIANTLNALLNQHLRHIGVIKLVGGQRIQVFFMYFTLIMAFAIMALIIAVPLGGQGAYGLSLFMGSKLNFSILGYRIQPVALGIQILVGLLIPLFAGLAPVINGSKITVLRALSGDASEDQPKVSADGEKRLSWFDWMQVRMTRILARRGIHIPRPFVISLRNTFRRKRRLVLTLFTLTMGGAIIIAVFNVRETLHDYIGQIGNYFVADISLDFDQPYRLREIEQKVMELDGVQSVEGWQFLGGDLLDENGDMLDTITVFGPPANSDLIEPIMVEGRWVQPGDVRKLAISEGVKNYYPDLKSGDYLNLKIDGRDERWQVIGLFKFVDREGVIAYAPFEYVSQVNNLANRSTSYRIVTERHDRPYQDAKAVEIDKYFRDLGYKVRIAQAGRASLDTAVESLDILVVFLMIMAILTAVVGSMGLTGTMGMNVLERTREIGIMRAIGADDRAVIRTVIAEGVVIGMLSFALAVVLSIPFTYLLSTIVSLAIFQSPIATVFTFTGYAIWLGLVLVLSALASILPARNAARLTIREVLAYE